MGYPIEYEGIIYPSTEYAYQAAKTLDINKRREIQNCRTPGDAKRTGRNITIRQDWEEIKYIVMLHLVTEKFKHPLLKSWLNNTGTAELVEFNTWHDQIWGVCTCPKCGGIGENLLGKILMRVRSEL